MSHLKYLLIPHDTFVKYTKLILGAFTSDFVLENFSFLQKTPNSISMYYGFDRNPIQYLLLNSQLNLSYKYIGYFSTYASEWFITTINVVMIKVTIVIRRSAKNDHR